MKSMLCKYSFGVFCTILILSCGSGQKGRNSEGTSQQSITIFAGASMTNVLSEIIDSFQVNSPIEVAANIASSGTLARQIEQGNIPDVYISASIRWADYIDSLGYIVSGYKTQIAKNGLSLIAPADSKLSVDVIDSTLDIKALLGSERLSMGDPQHVPAGKYAKQALAYYGWYQELNDKMLPAKDVRSALMMVEMGEAPLGIVYQTDAIQSKKIKVLQTFPVQSHKPILFIASVCNDNEAAKEFFNYLNSDTSEEIWKKYGFIK